MRDSKQYEPASREKLEQVVADHRGFIFDLDGTVYLGDELIDDAAEVIEQLREAGRRTVFLSNKPIARREVYARKLDRLGIPCLAEDVINSPLVLAQYLAETHPGARVYPVAEEPVIDELRDHGLRMTEEPTETDVVVVSWDRDFNYDKLRIAYQAAVNGAELVGTNPDRTCPMPGYDLPDAACMIAAIEACTERKVDPIVGKPSPIMLNAALEELELDREDCLMFGDRTETDIRMARDAGITSVLVLTGVTDRDHVNAIEIVPDLIMRSIGDLLPVLEEL